MGLDQYLYKKTYVKNWEWDASRQYEVTVLDHGQPISHIDPKRVAFIVEEVAYWRKANAIHAWFVENCQGGVDDCRNAYVDQDQLRALRDVIDVVLAEPNTAAQLLPTASGFFFGDTEYSEYYFDELRRTKDILDEILTNEDVYVEYEYHSSW